MYIFKISCSFLRLVKRRKFEIRLSISAIVSTYPNRRKHSHNLAGIYTYAHTHLDQEQEIPTEPNKL